MLIIISYGLKEKAIQKIHINTYMFICDLQQLSSYRLYIHILYTALLTDCQKLLIQQLCYILFLIFINK